MARELSVANIPGIAIYSSLVSGSWQRHQHIGVAGKMSSYVKRNSFNRKVAKGGDRREPQAQEQTLFQLWAPLICPCATHLQKHT